MSVLLVGTGDFTGFILARSPLEAGLSAPETLESLVSGCQAGSRPALRPLERRLKRCFPWEILIVWRTHAPPPSSPPTGSQGCASAANCQTGGCLWPAAGMETAGRQQHASAHRTGPWVWTTGREPTKKGRHLTSAGNRMQRGQEWGRGAVPSWMPLGASL